MFTQAFPNNNRTVSGTVDVYEDDLVLMCNTSSAAVTINLMSITQNYWSSQYRLYVVDASNNAATNNITVVAPSGFTINGQQSSTINQNKGGLTVTVISNTAYSGSYAGGGVFVAPPYFYAKKLLTNTGTPFTIAPVSAGTRTVIQGQQAITYTSKVENGITFDANTGIWTVITAGLYTVNAKFTTRINPTDINAISYNSNVWMNPGPVSGEVPNAIGQLAIGVIIRRGSHPDFLVACSNKQTINNVNISDVNIECSALMFQFLAGDQVYVSVFNKTDYTITDMPVTEGLQDCFIDFAVTKLT